ncbi:hypothetical protein N0V85_006003 [Neurospora sp. IMI 360204]|nr:hypothetical protein N0V85_006003 [Neurospora sp. IMI 360204]
MTPPKQPRSPGFIADANGNIYKRIKRGHESFYWMGDASEISKKALESVQDASKQPQLVSNGVASPKATVADEHPTTSGLPLPSHLGALLPSCAVLVQPAPEDHNSATPSSARRRPIDRTNRTDKATPTHRFPDRSPSPSGDTRIPLWQNETRAFKGTCELPTKSDAISSAESAQKAELWVDDKPQFNVFVDGSYKPYVELPKRNRQPEHRSWGRGGYGVAFRDPYHNDTFQSRTKGLGGKVRRRDFNIRSWSSYRVLSSYHTELAAIFQGLQTVLTSVRLHRPPSGASVCIFTDNTNCVKRLRNKRALADDEPVTLRDALIMPLVRAIVWLSHCLSDEGCEIKLQWLPRCCVRAHKLADWAAGSWKRDDAVFYQKDLPPWRRDGILDAVHEDLILDAVHEDLIKVVDRIEAGEQARLPPWAERQRGSKTEDDGDILENFSGSTLQKEIETHSEFMDMPSITESDPAPSMVVEDPIKSFKTHRGPRKAGGRRAGIFRRNCG